jgi:hypothetical protein
MHDASEALPNKPLLLSLAVVSYPSFHREFRVAVEPCWIWRQLTILGGGAESSNKAAIAACVPASLDTGFPMEVLAGSFLTQCAAAGMGRATSPLRQILIMGRTAYKTRIGIAVVQGKGVFRCAKVRPFLVVLAA